MRKSSSDPIGTLSVGNVVSTAVTLYKSNFRDYFSLALRSVGWLFLGFLGIALVSGAIAVNNAVLTLLVTIAWLVFFCFCLGKSMVSRAVISRLAYQQLANQPETKLEASRRLAPKPWKFLRLALWLGLFLVGVFILAYLALLAIGGLGVFLGTQISGWIGELIAGIFILGAIAVFLWLILSFYSQWFVAELPLALDDRLEALESIGRSRQLSKPFVVRIQFIVLVAFLITLPLTALANAPTIAYYVMLMNQIVQAGVDPTAIQAMSGNLLILQIAGLVLGFLVELFVVPFWQAIKSVVFFDVQSRREGADLQMR
jgi:hypothetical protein